MLIRSDSYRLDQDPGCPALRAERRNCQGRPATLAGPGEPGDGGAGERDLRDVIAAAHRGRAVPLAHPHLHAGDHDASPPSRLTSCSSRAWRCAATGSPAPSTRPPRRCRTTSAPGRRARGHRAATRSRCRAQGRHPPRRNQLGEILPGDFAGEKRPLPVRGTRRANRGAGGREIRPLRGSAPRDSRTPPPRARPARRTRRSSGRWPSAGPGTWPPPAARTTPDRPALTRRNRPQRALPRSRLQSLDPLPPDTGPSRPRQRQRPIRDQASHASGRHHVPGKLSDRGPTWLGRSAAYP